jgi:hypothetical protein
VLDESVPSDQRKPVVATCGAGGESGQTERIGDQQIRVEQHVVIELVHEHRPDLHLPGLTTQGRDPYLPMSEHSFVLAVGSALALILCVACLRDSVGTRQAVDDEPVRR